LFQPPHSPELNPIKQLWQDFKIDFWGSNFANLDGLRAAITEVLGYLHPDWIKSLTQYPFIMNALSDASIT
jgi:transposase